MSFLDDYEPVEERLAKFWNDHPDGQIHTEVLPAPEGQWVVKASVWRGEDDEPAATGHAQEVVGQGNVNKTSALENCETSAIGRALANLGYAAKGKRPSREEMAKTEPAAQDWKAWVWSESAIFKDWSEDERKQGARAAMERVLDGADDIANALEAQAVLSEMRLAYETRNDQGKLDVE